MTSTIDEVFNSGSRFHDLDAAIAEQTAEPVVIRLFSEDWELPGTWPAAVPLLLARWMADGRSTDDLTGAELLQLVNIMVPDEIYEQWTERGLSVEQLAAVVAVLTREYSPEERPPATGEATVSTRSTSSSDGD